MLGQLLEHGFPGVVYPVNPSHAEIAGLKSYEGARASRESGSRTDRCAGTQSARHSAVVRGSRHQGRGHLQLWLQRSGREGTVLHQRLKEICRRTGIRVAGPNTEGFYNIGGNTAATFNAAIDIDKGDLDASSHIAIVSQSGGLGFAFFNKGRRDDLVFSHIVSVGNQVDLEIADYVA